MATLRLNEAEAHVMRIEKKLGRPLAGTKPGDVEKKRKACPSEHEEQKALMRWVEASKGKYPKLHMIYAIPNAAKRSMRLAAMMKAEGMKSGVPDLHLAAPSGKYHGLYIEMKRTKGGSVSETQKEWLNKLNNHGYMAVVCRGWLEAKEVIEDYLKGR